MTEAALKRGIVRYLRSLPDTVVRGLASTLATREGYPLKERDVPPHSVETKGLPDVGIRW